MQMNENISGKRVNRHTGFLVNTVQPRIFGGNEVGTGLRLEIAKEEDEPW